MKILVQSSNNHYTESQVEVKENEVITESPYEVKHIEHEPLTITGNRRLRRVVEKDIYEEKLREICD